MAADIRCGTWPSSYETEQHVADPVAEVDAEVHVTELGQEVGAVGNGGVPAEVEGGLVEDEAEQGVMVIDFGAGVTSAAAFWVRRCPSRT